MKIETLETDRTISHRLQPEDRTVLQKIWSDRNVAKTLSADGQPFPEATIQQKLQRMLNHWETYQFGVWIFREKPIDRSIGYCGLKHSLVDGVEEIELLYAVVSERWGNGFATEMGTAVLNVGFETLHLSEIVCFTLTTNRASQRVMEKLGFHHDRAFLHVGLPHILYRHDRTTYRNC
ncbi:MAG: GNAT family N-acetyltransferase [Cyanobacteria bacterium SID2]|nr:GNAT family N-acetyltransferase [Cyanobacteria bacterium SID2]